MRLFRVDREQRGPDVWLPLKLALFLVGAIAGVLGMAAGRDWMVTLAIVLLALAIILRFIRPRRDD